MKPLAKRLDTLAGKTVAQLWDHVFRGDEVFEFLEAGLKARYPGVLEYPVAKRIALPKKLERRLEKRDK